MCRCTFIYRYQGNPPYLRTASRRVALRGVWPLPRLGEAPLFSLTDFTVWRFSKHRRQMIPRGTWELFESDVMISSSPLTVASHHRSHPHGSPRPRRRTNVVRSTTNPAHPGPSGRGVGHTRIILATHVSLRSQAAHRRAMLELPVCLYSIWSALASRCGSAQSPLAGSAAH